MNTKEWLETIGKSIDSLNAEKFAEFLTDDCTFRFGNQPDVNGKKAVTDYVAAFFKMIGGCEHKVIDFWTGKDSVVWQGEVLYTRLDGKKVNVGFTNIFRMNGKHIKDYLIYIDNTPLFS